MSTAAGNAKLRRTKPGDVYGRWLVLAIGEGGTSRHMKWLCRCACGTERSVWGNSLRSGMSTSCGCYASERISATTRARNLTHGLSETPEYQSWSHMINRCHNPKIDCFANYGGRGITVCAAWRESFETFLRDMGPRPSLHFTLDRIDNNRGYEPGNCRWASRSAQLNNRRNCRNYTYQGQTKTLQEWAEALGMSRGTLANRLDTMKLPVDVAFSLPINKTYSRSHSR